MTNSTDTILEWSVTKGNPLAGARWHYMDANTVARYGPWVRAEDYDVAIASAEAAKAKARESALRELASLGQASEAYESQLKAEAERDALQAENARMREVDGWQTMARAQHFLRRNMNAPEDPHVAVLCERYGYGAVMDAASRLWARKDGIGAFYIGGCIGMKTDDQARAALEAKE